MAILIVSTLFHELGLILGLNRCALVTTPVTKHDSDFTTSFAAQPFVRPISKVYVMLT